MHLPANQRLARETNWGLSKELSGALWAKLCSTRLAIRLCCASTELANSSPISNSAPKPSGSIPAARSKTAPP
jgi:hypothetical protein